MEFWKGYSLTLFPEFVEEKEPIFDFDIRGGLGGGSLDRGWWRTCGLSKKRDFRRKKP